MIKTYVKRSENRKVFSRDLFNHNSFATVPKIFAKACGKFKCQAACDGIDRVVAT